ncbi:MAG: glycosyltransferase [Thermoleophilaceae bacterium]|nr:glycosyltransferase [Thermoleophilaceae bacterium]
METYGGAERVTAELARVFPDAPVFALLGRPEVARRMAIEERFHSVLTPRPALLRHYRLFAPAYPTIADRVRLPAAAVLLSSSYAYAHRFRTRNDAPQVCYSHSPLRFAWSMTEGYRERWAPRRLAAPGFRAFARIMRESDRRASVRVARFLTQSPFTADQIESFYNREADVVGVPIDCGLFSPGKEGPEDFFLFSGRLIEPYKRVGVAIEAFRGSGRKLVVAGDGPAYTELRAMAGPEVEFTGHLEDAELVSLMRRCSAAVFPSRDDFGLVPVEVMACGRPVLAYRGGGAETTVKAGVTGEFFDEQTPGAIREALDAFDATRYDPAAIRAHAMQWDSVEFRRRVRAVVTEVARDR